MEETGGRPGMRDEGLLRSALARPQATFSQKDLYPTLFEKAACLAESILLNHPFVDGNKRMAWECLDLILQMNGYELTSSHEQNYRLIFDILQRKKTIQQTAAWLREHAKKAPGSFAHT